MPWSPVEKQTVIWRFLGVAIAIYFHKGVKTFWIFHMDAEKRSISKSILEKISGFLSTLHLTFSASMWNFKDVPHPPPEN